MISCAVRGCSKRLLPVSTFQSSSPGKRSLTDHVDEEDASKKILKASLPFVIEHGWSKESIGAGAESLGYSSSARGIFKSDGFSLVQYFQESCNEKLIDELTHRKTEGRTEKDEWSETHTVLESRLRMVVPMLPRWPEAMALLAKPNNAPESLKLLMNMSDDICHHTANQNELDMSWYTRRIFVAGLYLAGELSLIQDKSQDFVDTWLLLGRLINNRHKAENAAKQFMESGANLSALSSSAYTTVKNILGLNSYSR